MSTVAKPSKASHLLAPAAVMSVVLLMIVPLPPLMLDLLLSVDIGLAVTLLLTAIYVKQPVEFSVFPSLLLLLTLIRLSRSSRPVPVTDRLPFSPAGFIWPFVSPLRLSG